MFGRYRSSYGQQRNEGAFKKASSTTTERGDPSAQHRNGRQPEGNPSEQKKVTYPQAGSLEAQAEISTYTELKIPSKQQNYEEDQRVVREHRSGHCSTETSKSKVTPSVDIERRAQEKGNLEQKLDSPAEEELVEIASLVCEPWSPSPCDASGQAASNSSCNFLEVIKMKLESSQKQFEFKEKLAHERAMRETELKWNLDHQRALEKLQEKEAELQRLQQKNNRDTDGLEEAGNTELKEPEIQGKEFSCTSSLTRSLELGRMPDGLKEAGNTELKEPEIQGKEFSCTGSLKRRLELSKMPLYFGGIAEKSTAEKNPGERSDQPVKNKIHDLIIELKSLEEDNNPETLAFVEILSNHVRLHKKMIRSPKVSQKADLPKETKAATVDPIPKAEDASKQPDIDKKQGRKADTKPFASLPAPVPVSPNSTPPITSTPPLFIIFPIQVLVAGQAFGSDQQFLNQVEKHLEPSNIFLQKEPFTPSSDGLLLLFCPVVSRAGTDIINALEKSPAQAKIILVVMNHVPNESMTVYLDSRSKVHRQSVIHSVDCRFSERSGLYSSQMNNDAIISVARKIQEEAKARS